MRSIIIFIFLLLTTAAGAQVCGRVVKVYDGDTFTLLTDDARKVRVRLYGIDCPEKREPYGPQAQAFTAARIMGTHICFDSLYHDRYRRIVAIIPYGGSSVNEQLLSAGLASHYTKYDSSRKWAALQAKARKKKLGMWEYSLTNVNVHLK